MAIVCFGGGGGGGGGGRWVRGFVEIKIFDQNLTLHDLKYFFSH